MHANSKWLATTVIPADKPAWSPPYALHEDAQEKLRSIIEEAAGSTTTAPNSEARKVGDLYKSFMDESRIEALKLTPLAQEFAAIDAIKDKSELAAPVRTLDADQRRDTGRSGHPAGQAEFHHLATLSPGGLGLPDRDSTSTTTMRKLVGVRTEMPRTSRRCWR